MLLIFPFSMRESINYAIRARLRGEKILGACSHECKYLEYCDEFVIIPTIFEDGFINRINEIIKEFGITKFYSPSDLIWQTMKNILPSAEGSPLEIMNQEYEAAKKTEIPPNIVINVGHIYGHMNEEKLAAMLDVIRNIPPYKNVIEVGCAWGKSLKAISLCTEANIYAYDPWESQSAIQDAHPLINQYSKNIDWKKMEEICKINMPDVIYNCERIPNCSVLHIDGNHDYGCVREDWFKYGDKLESGGWLILDDIGWPGVNKLWCEIKPLFHRYHFIAGGALFAHKI